MLIIFHCQKPYNLCKSSSLKNWDVSVSLRPLKKILFTEEGISFWTISAKKAKTKAKQIYV